MAAGEGVPRERPKHGAKPAPAAGPIDLNRATEEQLMTLPGIGPALARRIVEGRPYRSADDLATVKEIGPRKLEEVRSLVRAE